MRININLASKPYEDARQFWTYWGSGIAVLALATLLLTSLAVVRFINAQHERKQIAEMQAVIARFDEERTSAEAVLNQPQNRVIRDRSRFLNDELFERKAFSWTRVFEDLEQVMPAHLRVLSVHPGLSKENDVEIKLAVGGDNSEQALDLVRKMEASKKFRETRIESQRTNDDNGSGNSGSVDRVRFDITALYVPEGTGAPAAQGAAAGGLD